MNRIKIMHFIHGLNTGGAETLVKNYMLNFDQKKYDVVLLCLRHEKGSPYEEKLRKRGIRMVFVQDNLRFDNETIFYKKIMNYFCNYIIVKKTINLEKPDILHTHLPINGYIKFARPSKNTIIFHTVHSDPDKLWPKDNKRRMRDFRAVKWLIAHRNMKLIVLHEGMKNMVDKMFGISNSIVLNNGVDVDSIKSVVNRDVIREELNIAEEAFVIGHIGRFSKVKNQKFLVDILSSMERKRKNSFLLMVGDGPDKNKIMKELDERGLNGKYLILSNRQDVPDLFAAMDIFVFPSLYEGLPLSLIEAQVANKPCFISDKVNQKAVISNLVTSLSIDDNPKKWADTILDYKKPQKIIVNEEDWDIKRITKQLEQLYMDALMEKNNGKK